MEMLRIYSQSYNVVILEENGGGYIAGSKHVNFTELFSEDGTLKSDSELKASMSNVIVIACWLYNCLTYSVIIFIVPGQGM